MSMRKLLNVFSMVRLSQELNSIRFIVLMDGTVYENGKYECSAPLISAQQLENLHIFKKEEPATAATVTSPENEKILNESISPENENVKPVECAESSGDVPEAVKDAVHNEISRIETAIEKTMEIILRLTAEADKLSAKKNILLKWGEENA